ncbi:LysR family transcriptional regulator [Motilimonas pumila]|uniref:LysR family transcriptional regulator n=1 Tax=Motilimonas pumila TaxID=2303987 RepID=A0A418YB43_9GAMM|nr:LysR family transcriptional regulator [Motilimonas pumila]RJG40189.1 LysR family transcriptional regulator [Motilimonas pumila]
MLNPVWLHTFRTLVEVGHFTHTAEKLNMTQPGVSQHVQKLEQSCRQSLIRRINKRFELTEAGRILYDYALQHAAREQALLAQIQHDDPYQGDCRLACSGSMALWLYPQLLNLQQQHPLQIHLEVAPNHRIISAVANGDIQLGIVTQPPIDARLSAQLLGDEPLCLVLPKRYQDKPITVELLQQCAMIAHPDLEHYLQLFLNKCGHPGFDSCHSSDFPVIGYINQIHQILQPVRQGIGATVLPLSAIKAYNHQQDLYIAPTQAPVTEALYLLQRKHQPLAQRYVMLKQWIDQHWQQMASASQ